MELYARQLPSTKECNDISFTKLPRAQKVATLRGTWLVPQPCLCLSEQHRQVPCPLLAQWEHILLSARIPAACEAGGMGKKQLQWKVKGMKMHFSNCLIFSFQELCSPSALLSLTQPGVAQLSQGTTPWLSLHFPHGQKTSTAVKSSGAGAHPQEGRFRMVKYLWAAAAEGFWASWHPKWNFEPLNTPWEFWTSWYPMGILLEEASPSFCAQVLHLTPWCSAGTVGHQDDWP